jgi:tetratricopeptide (TPR) repeat protein
VTRIALTLSAVALVAATGMAESLEQARALSEAQEWPAAVEAYRALPPHLADQYEALYGLAEALRQVGDLAESTETARKAIAVADNDVDKAWAFNELGLSLRQQGTKSLMREAVDAFQQAGALDPRMIMARLSQAETLLTLKDVAAAEPLLRALASEDPQGAVGLRAAALLRNPENVQYASLPAFKIQTLDGEVVSSQGLLGQVVLVDFWATWCQPCIASLPTLGRFHAYTHDRPLRLVSVSVDESADVLRRFVAEKEMDWTVIHDGSKAFAHHFGVSSYPTYLLVDADGFIVDRISGYSSEAGDALSRLTMRARLMGKKVARRRDD